MLDKKQAKTWVKVVAWTLAVVFGTSFSFLFLLPSPTTKTSSSPAPGTINATPQEQALSMVGQAEIALDNEDYNQAIRFFEEARALDPGSDEIVTGLAEAYYNQGVSSQDDDVTTAIAAFNGYLETLPNGPKANEVKGLLSDIQSADTSPADDLE